MTQYTVSARREKRRRAILDAAHGLFLQKGYEATTVKDIVARSGGSLETLYSLFGGKHALLSTMVTEHCAAIAERIRSVQLSKLEFADGLRAIARHLLCQLTDPGSIGLFRVVVATAPSLPELRVCFYQAGPSKARQLVANFLQDHDSELGMDDPQEAAALFMQMVVGDLLVRRICCVMVPEDERVRERHIDSAVEAFMGLYAARPRESKAAAAG